MSTLRPGTPAKPRDKKAAMSPTQLIVISFALVILTGTLLLSLPTPSRDGSFTPLLDSMFTATSATCVTGLIVFDTYLHFSLFGQLVILTLIQIGGLGLITLVTFFTVAMGRKLGFKSMSLAQESINAQSMVNLSQLLRMVVVVSLCIEGIGAIIMCFSFVPRFGLAQGIYTSIFLAVSAFCNAGFDILGHEGAYSSLIHYTDDPIVIGTISLLIIIGGLGFVVWRDLWDWRKTKKLQLHTKIVLMLTGGLIVGGTIFFCAFEWNNPQTMGGLSTLEKLGAGYFQSVSTRTAGFNSINLADMSGFTKLFASIWQFIGAAPGSTGGGIKVTTFAVLVMTVVSMSRGRGETVMLRHRIDPKTVYKAISITCMAIMIVLGVSIVMYLSMRPGPAKTPINAIFEACSAFGTVGLSVGVTEQGTALTHIVTSLTMFIGRVGPASLAISLAMPKKQAKNRVMPEGKLLVG